MSARKKSNLDKTVFFEQKSDLATDLIRNKTSSMSFFRGVGR